MPLPPSREYKQLGLIVAVHDSRESDLVVRIATEEQGKLVAIARGAKRSKKRFGAPLDLFDRGIFEAKLGRGKLPNLDGFIAKQGFKELRSDLSKICAASVVCETYDLLTPEAGAEENDGSFRILDEALRTIDRAKNDREIIYGCNVYLNSVTQNSGFAPPAVPSEEELFSKRSLASGLGKIEHLAERAMRSKVQCLEVLSA